MADIEVPHPGASDIVARMLSDALSEHPDVRWLGLVSEDGFAIASEGSVSVDDDAVAAGAVRLMIQVRAMSKALGQPGTSQMFLEGGESGICVIDKDPWVLVVVGAPGVPIGLLRYEAREIAETFPMGRRAALPAGPEEHGDAGAEADADWAVVNTGTFGADAFTESYVDVEGFESPAVDLEGLEPQSVIADDNLVTALDREPEIRWADEPTTDDIAVVVAEPRAGDIFAEAGLEQVEELEMPSVGPDDFSDWLTSGEPSRDPMFDLPPPASDAPFTFEMPAPDVPSATFDAPVVPAVSTTSLEELADLGPPMGPAIDLPPPTGPSFELPPPE